MATEEQPADDSEAQKDVERIRAEDEAVQKSLQASQEAIKPTETEKVEHVEVPQFQAPPEPPGVSEPAQGATVPSEPLSEPEASEAALGAEGDMEAPSGPERDISPEGLMDIVNSGPEVPAMFPDDVGDSSLPSPEGLLDSPALGQTQGVSAFIPDSPSKEGRQDNVFSREAGKAKERGARLGKEWKGRQADMAQEGIDLSDAETGQRDQEDDGLRQTADIAGNMSQYNRSLMSTLYMMQSIMIEGIQDMDTIQNRFHRLI